MDISSFLQFQIGSLTVQTLLIALLLILVGVLIAHAVLVFVKRLINRSALEESFKNILYIAARVILYILVILIVADYLGLPVTSLLAVVSVAGLAVSLAIQDTLANVFSGVLMLAAKTFSEGDYVQLNGLEGSVTRVDLMSTHLRTADNKTVRIPNKDVQNSAIINYSRENKRRIEIRVTASYNDATEAVKAALLKAAERAELVLDTPAPFAGLFSYQHSSIEYLLWAWTDSKSYWPAYFALTEAVRDAFEEDGITMTYDHLNVHLQGGDRHD